MVFLAGISALIPCHPNDPLVPFLSPNSSLLQLEQQAEAIELANSVLIEVNKVFNNATSMILLFQISKTSVKNWQSKLQTRYGWFKGDNCKNIIFDVSLKAQEQIGWGGGGLEKVHGV